VNKKYNLEKIDKRKITHNINKNHRGYFKGMIFNKSYGDLLKNIILTS
jgi:ribosomal protein S6